MYLKYRLRNGGHFVQGGMGSIAFDWLGTQPPSGRKSLWTLVLSVYSNTVLLSTPGFNDKEWFPGWILSGNFVWGTIVFPINFGGWQVILHLYDFQPRPTWWRVNCINSNRHLNASLLLTHCTENSPWYPRQTMGYSCKYLKKGLKVSSGVCRAVITGATILLPSCQQHISMA